MWFGVATAAAFHCGFELPTQPFVELPPHDKVLPGALEVRDAFGDFETLETEHFAVKWGPELSPSPEHLERIAADLESSWSQQVDVLEWLPPPGTETYKLNVYLGSTGGGIPEIDFEGGYVWLDEEGQPYMVLSPATLDNYDNPATDFWPVQLIAHEFNHTLQIRIGVDASTELYIWEATASFMVPYSTGHAVEDTSWSWGGYLLNPQLSLETHSLDESDPERNSRQYQSALFLYDLAENQGHGQELIRDAWHTGLPDGALQGLDGQLSGGLHDAFTTFAATHAVGDHPLAEHYDVTAEAYMDFLGVANNRRTAEVDREGTEGWERVEAHLRPESYAWNRIRWPGGIDGEVTVEFRADPEGTRGTASEFQTVVVQALDGTTVYHPFDGSLTLDLAAESKLDLIVVSLARADDREAFGYEYAITLADDATEPIVPTPSEFDSEAVPLVCGCQSTPAPSGWLLLTALLFWQRSRIRGWRGDPGSPGVGLSG